jgi:AbrB family looped-hinge helix DNA binding protein
MAEATISSKNQVVIPREAREALGLKTGDKIEFVILGKKVLVLQKPTSYAAALRGIASVPYPKNYLRKERASWR